ncbi:MAG: ComF family protein [Candidatus Polarisedimenticolaceae bacterium]|nr:ComF family protein [Candidatus Polarisedimenticolaceae bacterium]
MLNMAICHGCFNDLPWNLESCPCCASPLPTHLPNNNCCGKCQKRPPAFDRSLAPLRYEGEVALLISAFKFKGKLEYGCLLTQILADHLADNIEEWPQLILPVPLHKHRLRERGYNQSLEVARLLGKRFGIPIEYQQLQRHRNTAHQSDLNYAARRKNIRNAFTLTKPLNATSVALIDDVVTTGETVAEISRLLKKGGAQRIEVWALARTP